MKKRVMSLVLACCLGLSFAGCGENRMNNTAEPAAEQAETVEEEKVGTADIGEETDVVDFSDLSDEYRPWADKYVMAAEKLSQCLPVEGVEISPEQIHAMLTDMAVSIDKQAMSDSEKSEMDNLIAKIDNLFAQSKNMCDTKLNDIIVMSQGDYSGEFEQKMNEERKKYDELISAGKYKDAYDQLGNMEEIYLSYNP